MSPCTYIHMSPSRSYVARVPALAQHKTTTHTEQKLTLTQLLCGFLVQVLNVVTRNLGGEREGRVGGEVGGDREDLGWDESGREGVRVGWEGTEKSEGWVGGDRED